MATQVTGSYPDVYDWENLYTVFRRAANRKRGRGPAAEFEFRLEDNLIELQNDLKREIYQPGEYVNFNIHEPKLRLNPGLAPNGAPV